MIMIIIMRTMANIFLNVYYVPGIVQSALYGLTRSFNPHNTLLFQFYR